MCKTSIFVSGCLSMPLNKVENFTIGTWSIIYLFVFRMNKNSFFWFVNTQSALLYFSIKPSMTKSLVIILVAALLIQGGTLFGSFQPAAGKGSDWKCIVASVLQHLLLWPGLFLWIWWGTLVVLLAYPSVCLAGFILQSMCLTGCDSVFDWRASSFPLLGERTYKGHLAIFHSTIKGPVIAPDPKSHSRAWALCTPWGWK